MSRVAPSNLPKIALFPVLLAAACLVAGLYGALHNQVSYTVSPDYFHALKFDQFHIPEDLHGRVGASVVGCHASWWMGGLIGVPVLLVALIMPGWKRYVASSLTAFVVVAGTAFVVGLAALAWACCTITQPEVSASRIVADPLAFTRARFMHDFSYQGGFLGIVTGSLYLIVARVRLGQRCRQMAASGISSAAAAGRIASRKRGASPG
jgi:hypothetical protein